MYLLFYLVVPQLCHNCHHLCQHWCYIYWFLIHCIINNWSSIWYHLMGRPNYSIAVCPEMKDISFIKIVFKGTLVKKLYWCIRKVVLETWDIFISKMKKGRYIRHYMPDSQYKSEEKYRNICSYCCFMTPVDIYFVGASCQNFVYLSQVHWLQYTWMINPSQFLTICWAIIIYFSCMEGNNTKRAGPRDTTYRWVSP